MTTKKGVFLGCGLAVLAALVLGGGIFFFVMRLTAPLVETGDRFLAALQGEHYDEATALCTTSLERDLEGKGGLKALAERYKIKPVKWRYSSRSIKNGAGELTGSVTHADGAERGLRLTFSESGDDWKLNGFNFD